MRTRSPWTWVPTLFGAEEIPSAMVTFVALLMFLQRGVSPARATFFSALLFLPWMLKSFVRSWIRRRGHFRHTLHWIEAFLFLSLVLVALSFPYGQWALLGALMITSLLCSWHELAARMYYERMLRPPLQRIYTGPKIFFSQLAVVLTYGMLIIVVGSLQVYYRHLLHAWSMGCYLLAGCFALFAIYHLYALQSPQVGNRSVSHSMKESLKAEIHVIDRIRQQPYWFTPVLSLFFLLLPQSLMFYTRVIYLYDIRTRGGLGCSIQEIGFAQGTVGVIAFCIGLTIGRRILKSISLSQSFWPLALTLGISPLAYLTMTLLQPDSLWTICACTSLAQFCFGLGLYACRLPVLYISGERYRNTINLLYIPLVATCIIPPAALSGWLTQWCGYHHFFMLDALSAPIGWMVTYFLMKRFPTASPACCSPKDEIPSDGKQKQTGNDDVETTINKGTK